MHQQPPAPPTQDTSTPSTQQESRIAGGAKAIGSLILLYLVGPAPFFAKGLQDLHQQDLSTQGTWHAERRRNHHTSARIAGPLLCYAIIAYFHEFVTSTWSGFFATVAGWIHLPIIAAAGAVSIFPPTPGNLLFRWVLLLPLTPLLARLLEKTSPSAPLESKRIITPEEHQAALAEIAAEQAERKAIVAAKRAEKAARAPRTHVKAPAKPQRPYIPPKSSLWGQIDWSQVDDQHPVKQAAFEAAQQVLASRREEERQLQAKQGVPDPLPSTSPAAPSSKVPAEDDVYDWDSGEGTITL